MKYNYFDKMNVSMLKHIPKTKFMYCIGVGNNGINEKKLIHLLNGNNSNQALEFPHFFKLL